MRKTIMILFFLCPALLHGQVGIDFNKSILSNDQKLIKAIVDSSICLIRQDYILKSKNGGEYGRSGKKYFGRAYGLGVMSDNKVWIDKKIATPWELDKYFVDNNFQKIDTLKPQNYALSILKKGDTKYQELTASTHIQSDSLLLYYQTAYSLWSIPSKMDSKDSTGWLVIMSSKDDLTKNELSPLNYTIYRPSPKFLGTKGEIKPPVSTENMIGGVYFSQVVSRGKIMLYASGLLKKIKTDWFIISFSDKEIVKNANDLTPIKSKALEEIERKRNADGTTKPKDKKKGNNKEPLSEI